MLSITVISLYNISCQLYFSPQCGVCDGQLGDATAGTDVRIRNGLLSCHECYIASRGENTQDTHRLVVHWHIHILSYIRIENNPLTTFKHLKTRQGTKIQPASYHTLKGTGRSR